MPLLRADVDAGRVSETEVVGRVMRRFRRRRGEGGGGDGKGKGGGEYWVCTLDTGLGDLEGFFYGGLGGVGGGDEERDFAVVTDEGRRFVVGVVTRGDLEEFVRRRPA